MFNRFAKSMRGVSPVIASVILIGAAIATGLVVVTWANNSFVNQQSEAGVFFAERSAAMEESFVIEDVWFNVDEDYVNVTVRNVGAVNLTVVSVSLSNETYYEAWNVTQDIAVEEAETINIALDLESGESYYIVVASARGNQVREYYSTSG